MKIFGMLGVGVLVSSANVFVKNTDDIDYSAFNDQQTEEYLQGVASNLNRNLPRKMEEGIRGDRVVARNNTITYNYTLMEYSASEIDMKTMSIEDEALIVNGICSNEDMKIFGQMDATIEYSYHGNDGRHIGDISVSSSQCDSV